MNVLQARSLRWRLIRTISLVVLLVWGLGVYFSYREAELEAEELMDGSLAQNARLLLALAHDHESRLPALIERLATSSSTSPYEPPLEFQLLGADGGLLMRSPQAPESVLTAQSGYADLLRDGRRWRAYCELSADSGVRAIVFQSMQLRDTVAFDVASRSALPIGLALPILLALIYFSIRRSLAPLDKLAEELACRSTENLADLSSKPTALELQGLAGAINHLLQRLRRTLDNERRFTADAAHELRTPLAALKIHAQVAQASDDGERQHALAQTVTSVDRAIRVVEQLLRLARLDPLSRPAEMTRIDLGRLAANLVDEARERGPQAIVLELPPGDLAIVGDRELLALAWRNLLENAQRHTPPETEITAFVSLASGSLCIGVADSGPGCPEADLPRLQERFFRGSRAAAEGSGLGLAIVSRIAELHGARLELANRPEGGFVARIRW